MELYEKLGIAESADEDIVKQAFREKKMELQKQLGAKNPDVQKQASADLSELIHAYAVWKKQQGTSNEEKAKIKNPAIERPVQEAAQKEKPISVPMASQAVTVVNQTPSTQSTTADGVLQTVSREENTPTVKILIAVLGIIVVILVGYIVYMHSANNTTRENLNKKVDMVEPKSGFSNEQQQEKENIQSCLRFIDRTDDEIENLAQDINRMTGKKGDVREDIRRIKEKGKDLQSQIDKVSARVQINQHISARHVEALVGLLALEKKRISLLMSGVDEWQDGSETLPSFKEGTRLSNEFDKVLAQYKAAL